jgi:hypothetical protein
MPGHSTVVHQAVGPAPAATKELVHIEAMPHGGKGKVKVHAHVMEGGSSTKHEHIVSNWGEAHQKMGEYMTGGADGAAANPEQEAQRQEEPGEMEA